MLNNILKIILLLLIFSDPGSLFSQTVKGKVFGIRGDSKEVLDSAAVKFIDSDITTLTDHRGYFSLAITGEFIIVSRKGFIADTVSIKDKNTVFVYLKSEHMTDEIIVRDSRSSILFGKDIKEQEIFTQLEFRKAACCDLSGCFGNTVSIETKVTDAVSNNKELKLLGLEGYYTQILFDGIPIFSGLNARYGMSGIPGTLINRITVSKGANTVIQGTESMSGILNIIPKEYSTSERLFVNAFMNEVLEKQLNLNSTGEFGNWQTLITGHVATEAKRTDNNNDNFLDVPLINRQMVFNKWNFENDKRNFRFELAGRFNSEKITGGEKDFNEEQDKGTNKVYGQVIDFNIFDMYSKAGKIFEEGNEVKLFAGYSRHKQNSYFGLLNYKARQDILYLNSFWEKYLSGNLSFKNGLSYRLDRLDEFINTGDTTRTYGGTYDSKESIPGIFSEISIDNIFNRLSILGGARMDFNNLYGTYLTPRILIKYDLNENTIIRLSSGTGMKSPNIFIEHANILASSRDIIIPSKLNPEKLFNFGLNFQHEFNMENLAGNLIMDFYRSEFTNRIIADYDREPGKVYFENLNGSAFSNVFQTELNLIYSDALEIKAAYKFTGFSHVHNGIEREEPFIPKHHFLASLSYRLPDNSWAFDASANWFGRRKLHSTDNYPLQYRINEYSDPYTVLNLQATKLWKTFEIYAGIENLLDKRQTNPILAADDPFGPYFDTSFIYAPTTGREFYGGLRFRIFD